MKKFIEYIKESIRNHASPGLDNDLKVGDVCTFIKGLGLNGIGNYLVGEECKIMKINFDSYYINFNNGKGNYICRRYNLLKKEDPEIKWWNNGELEEKKLYELRKLKHKDDLIGARVKMNPESVYYSQAYVGGDGFGEILNYASGEDVGVDDHPFKVRWTNGHDNVYRWSDLIFMDEEEKGKIIWWINGKLNENDDPLSTSDVKITVDGDKGLINHLIDNMSLIVQKRKTKPLRINSVNGYINKETFKKNRLFYETYLEIDMINKDHIVGEYKSMINGITIIINDELVYDMEHRTFDNEVLMDKIVNEYKKYLKNKKFKIND